MIIRWKNKEMDCLQARGLLLTRRSQRLRRAGRLTYGNLTGGKASAVQTTSDWTNVTIDSRGVVYKYSPNNKTVHRWNYLNPNR